MIRVDYKSLFLDICNSDIRNNFLYGYARIECNTIIFEDIYKTLLNFTTDEKNNIITPKYRLSRLEYAILCKMTSFTNKNLYELFYPYDETAFQFGSWRLSVDEPYICRLWFNSNEITNRDLRMLFSRLLNWCLKKEHEIFNGWTAQKIYISLLIAMINTFKNQGKYKHFDKLIGFYEFHYSDLYLLKFIKSKISESHSCLMEEFKSQLSNQLKLKKEVDFDEWSNENLMKMSSLLQIITIQYAQDIENVMGELNDITNLIEVKYAFLKSHLEEMLETQKMDDWHNSMTYKMGMGIKNGFKNVGDITKDVVLLGVGIPLFATLYGTLRASAGTYKVVTGDERDIDLIAISWFVGNGHRG